MSNKPFKTIGALRPGRSAFDLSHEKKLTCDMGQLIPVMCLEAVPGDHFTLGNQAVVRMQPLVAPVLHEINIFFHDYFVPYRILDEDFEEFITKGITGDVEISPPEWVPTDTSVGSLWDFLGFPTGVTPVGAYPLDYPRMSYNDIYNKYYRDENLITEVALTNEDILLRAWQKDYFSSALPWQQRGTAPSLPLSGTTSATWDASLFTEQTGDAGMGYAMFDASLTDHDMHLKTASGSSAVAAAAKQFMDDNEVDFADAVTFNVADLRLAFQIQKWMERNARAGVRMTEFLRAHFGIAPRDERLDRPEYIGGAKATVITSEVLQTSSTDATSPQGNLAGHGIGISDSYQGKYLVKEFGLIMRIMSIMPVPAYQQGINRAWLRKTPHEFFFPEFENLSEQAILQAEIYATGVSSENNTIFGYQGRFDEMRYQPNQVLGEMRTTFDYWHLGRKFASAPLLNQSFIECDPDKRIFAVQNEPGFIVQVANLVKALRPIKAQAEPGLIDHN